ncbi:hypothetical protein HN51_028592 [Arachis hypogaea]|uniref:uncharacterized protein isoform X1 n=1 Tax=Arachis hypogaea TaxID=3818 RepID=UPI000DEC7712|nr:uncharacterized protein LOC112711229 isoform X1 [Arachis hypogaea]QHO35115.1 uncharacterized protein DS421_9g272790 [Arachis hypogaea]
MVLGIKSRSRKSGPTLVKYIIHIQEIKPWPPSSSPVSPSLKSAKSVELQWDHDGQSSGSLLASCGNGKIEFNQSLTISVLLSNKGKFREGFQKNLLEFNLYDKTVKSQLIGSATINLAEFGIIKETKDISTVLSTKRSFRSSAQTTLYVAIQPIDTESSSSSPNSSLSKEFSVDREDSESVSVSRSEIVSAAHSVDDDDDELEIASFTDDDDDAIPANKLQNIRSDSQNTGSVSPLSENDSIKAIKVGTKGSNGKSVLSLGSTTSSSLKSTKGEASTQFNGSKSPPSPTVDPSDMGIRNAKDEASTQSNGIKSPSLSAIRPSNTGIRNAEGEASTQFNGINSPSSPAVWPSDMAIRNQKGEAASTEFNGIKSPPSPVALSSDMGIRNTKGEASTEFNGITSPSSPAAFHSNMGIRNTEGEALTEYSCNKSPSSSIVLPSDMGNATSGRRSSSKIYEENMEATDECSEISESIQRSHRRNFSKGEIFESISSASYNSPSRQPIFGRSPQSQVAREGRFTKQNVKVTNESSEIPESTQQSHRRNFTDSDILESKSSASYNSSSRKPFFGRSSQSQFARDDRFGKENAKVTNESSETPESIQQSHRRNFTDGDILESVSSASYNSSSRQSIFGRSSQSQVAREDRLSKKHSGSEHGYNEYDQENANSVFDTDDLKEKEEMEEIKEQEQFTMRNEVVDNFCEDDFTRKSELNNSVPSPKMISHENPTHNLLNDNAEDASTARFDLQSVESRSETLDQAEEINDVDVGGTCHENVNRTEEFIDDTTESESINRTEEFIDDKIESKAKVEMLLQELTEAAALEVSLYSVIAEHGSSSNKVHTPARRLSRFYSHACKVGTPANKASVAQSAVSGFVLVSKACGNDVPRLAFWLSNMILLRALVSKELDNAPSDGIDARPRENEKENTENHFPSWEEPETFLVALEKVEAWIFSRIVESVWWQTLTPYMQSAAAKSSGSRKTSGKRKGICDDEQGSFSIDLWKRAFNDACERLCPLRAGGHECGCLPLIASLVMEQLINRLDVAMFNAILRDSTEDMPTDPISDPISDSKVLPIPSGKSGFGAGAQLKNAIGTWSIWLSDLFGVDDSDDLDDGNESDVPKLESSYKPFSLLNALSDLMMLPFEKLTDAAMRKEVCPRFGIALIRRVVNNFVPDEFCPGPVPDAVIQALNDENIEDDEGSITSFPCNAGSTSYTPLPSSSVAAMLQDVGRQSSLRCVSFAPIKLYNSDDELEKLDSPLSALGLGIDDSSVAAIKGGRKVLRYQLLRQVWKNSQS